MAGAGAEKVRDAGADEVTTLRGRSRTVVLWALVIADALLIFILSSRPRPSEDLPENPLLDFLFDTPGMDKVTHFFSYLLLGLLASFALDASRRDRDPDVVESNFAAAFLFAMVYGLTDELHQYFVPDRSMDLADFLADAAGAFAGCALVMWLVARRTGPAGSRGRRAAAASGADEPPADR